LSDKICFADFMLTPQFSQFSTAIPYPDFPLKEEIKRWGNQRIVDTIDKINIELLRRDSHGLQDSPFNETTTELYAILYALTTKLKARLDKELHD